VQAVRILWGQIVIAVLIALFVIFAAAQSTLWRLGLQPQLGDPWFYRRSGMPADLTPAFFSWGSGATPMCDGLLDRGRLSCFARMISVAVASVLVRSRGRTATPIPTVPPAERHRPKSAPPACLDRMAGPAMAACTTGSPPKLFFADQLSFECAGDLRSEPDIEANDLILSTVKAKFTLTILIAE
jgi:hypothetical protein